MWEPWKGLLTEEENVRGMVRTWEKGWAVLTTPTAWFGYDRHLEDLDG